MKENLNDEEFKGNEDLKPDTSDLENNEILQIKDDRLFHDLFNKHEVATIEWVVSEILNCPLEEVKGNVTTNTERLTLIRPTERSKYVDLLVFYKEEFILIELNNNYTGNPSKNLTYATNLLSSYYDFEIDEDKTNISSNKIVYIKGDTKVFVKPSRGILVNLNWYPPTATKRKREIPGKIVTNWDYPADSAPEFQGYCLKIININLDYYANLCYDNVTKEEKVFKLLTIDNQNDLNALAKDMPNLKNYVNKLKNLSQEKEYRNMLMNERISKNLIKQDEYFQSFAIGRDIGEARGEEHGKAIGLQEGKTLGFQEGSQQKQHDMIINLYNQGIELSIIANASELPESEVNEIINDSSSKIKKK